MDNDNGINDELEDLDLDSPLDSGQQYNDLMSDIVDIPVVMADTDQGRDAQNRGRAIAVGTEIEASTSDEEIDERNIVDPRLVSGVKPTFSMPIPTRHQLPKDTKQVEQDVLNDSGRGESQADINNNTFRNDVSMSQSLTPEDAWPVWPKMGKKRRNILHTRDSKTCRTIKNRLVMSYTTPTTLSMMQGMPSHMNLEKNLRACLMISLESP